MGSSIEHLKADTTVIRPIVIRVTGGIGSGKSTLCDALQKLGASTFNADFWAKRLMTEDEQLRSEVQLAFGKNTYTETGNLDRDYLADVVFNNEHELQRLNGLVHPAVFRAFEKELVAARSSGAKFLVYEAALLTDRKPHSPFHVTVVVDSPPDLRRDRVRARDGVDDQKVTKRMNQQPTPMEYFSAADYVVLNDGDKNTLEAKAERLLESIVNYYIPALLRQQQLRGS